MFSRFDYYLCKCFFEIRRVQMNWQYLWPSHPLTEVYRTDELFDIIVDYPDSLAALEDLKVSFIEHAQYHVACS